jgi:predicted outer membrane repeat protein
MRYKIIFILFVTVLLANVKIYGTTINYPTTGWPQSDTTLNADTVKVISNFTIPDNVTLTILPGTVVEFQGDYNIRVRGTLKAIGNTQDSIQFTAPDTLTNWEIDLYYITPNNDSSIFSFCVFEKSNGQLAPLEMIFSDKVRISNCYFRNNNTNQAVIFFWGSNIMLENTYFVNNHAKYSGGALYITHKSLATIRNNIFYMNSAENSGGAIHCQDSASSPTIVNNWICNNYTDNGTCGPADGGGAIRVKNGATPYIGNNIIANNYSGMTGGAIDCLYNGNAIIENNTIVNNDCNSFGGGIYMFQANPIINNNIIWGNTRLNTMIDNQIGIFTDDSEPDITFSCIQGDTADFWTANGVTYTGLYQNNISTSPQFVSPSLGSGLSYDGLLADWNLNPNSPCINAGSPTTYSLLPSTDIGGNQRISGGTIDIGAYESTINTSISEFNNSKINVYPNPTSGIVYLDLSNADSEITLQVLSVDGRIIKTFKGIYASNLTIDLSDEANGLYFFNISSNKHYKTFKIAKY